MSLAAPQLPKALEPPQALTQQLWRKPQATQLQSAQVLCLGGGRPMVAQQSRANERKMPFRGEMG